MPKFDVNKLEKLSGDARARVENALVKTLDAEIALQPGFGGGDLASKHSRSKGAIFSRSLTSPDAAIRPGNDLDARIIEKIDVLDDAAFARFTSRLATLKGGGL